MNTLNRRGGTTLRICKQKTLWLPNLAEQGCHAPVQTSRGQCRRKPSWEGHVCVKTPCAQRGKGQLAHSCAFRRSPKHTGRPTSSKFQEDGQNQDPSLPSEAALHRERAGISQGPLQKGLHLRPSFRPAVCSGSTFRPSLLRQGRGHGSRQSRGLLCPARSRAAGGCCFTQQCISETLLHGSERLEPTRRRHR